jgi:hypothetical protein
MRVGMRLFDGGRDLLVAGYEDSIAAAQGALQDVNARSHVRSGQCEL